MEVVLGMLFLTLSNMEVEFSERKLIWRSYTPTEALPTTRRLELIDMKEFAKAALDENVEGFVVHIALLSLGSKMSIHPTREAQIALLLTEGVIFLAEYLDYIDIFSKNSNAELPKRTKPNKNAIDLIESKQPPYRPIYSLGPVGLETLKTYIKTNLANSFIRPSKFLGEVFILFGRKTEGSPRLCVDYRGLNNLPIRNRYPLLLIGESLDRLGRAQRFTQLDLTGVYYRMRMKEGDQWKAAFRTQYGHFEYQFMPFGLSNTPASF